MKKIIKNFIPAVLCFLLLCACAAEAPPSPVSPGQSFTVRPLPTPSPGICGSVTLSFVGDCTFGDINDSGSSRGFDAVYKNSGSDTWPFDLVSGIFREDDLTVANFEGTITQHTEQADKQWHFRGKPEYASIFPASSVEAVSLANNHSGDYMEKGFEDTLAAFAAAGVPTVQKDKPYVTEINGIRVVIIADCSIVGENTTQTRGVSERVIRQIDEYKREDTVIAVFMHWGSEYSAAPGEWEKSAGRSYIDAGADAVVGCHPHILQGIERYNGAVIAYSLGNFAFGGNRQVSSPETVILQLKITLRGGSRTVDFTAIPCFTTSSGEIMDSGNLKNNYRPIPLEKDRAQQVLKLLEERSKFE